MNKISKLIAFVVVATGGAAVAEAQSAGNLLGGPVIAAGGALNSASAGHAGIAPTVNKVSPSAEGVTDGVTNAIGAVGQGTTAAGQSIQDNGVVIGSSKSGGQPLVTVGATKPGSHGSAVAVLNGH